MRTLIALSLLAVAGTAARSQSSIADCEKIQAADAYNQCLAKFGPAAKEHNLEPERPGDVKSSAADARASAPARANRHFSRGRHHGRVATRHRHGHAVHTSGRKRMTIKVK